MKTQIITALSIAAVLGSAGGAYAINQTMLSTASTEQSVIGSATPVLVPVAPKGNDIPQEYLDQLAAAADAAKTTPLGSPLAGSTTSSSSSSGTAPAPSASPSSDDDDQYDDSDDDDNEDEHESEDDHEDESDDDD